MVIYARSSLGPKAQKQIEGVKSNGAEARMSLSQEVHQESFNIFPIQTTARGKYVRISRGRGIQASVVVKAPQLIPMCSQGWEPLLFLLTPKALYF